MAAEAAARAIEPAEFDGLMGPLGPFETHPRLAVAVSGGLDSMALTLLADRWARARGGQVVGLTVDHGLRPAAAREARQVKAWLAARGIGHVTLRGRGNVSQANLQAEARALRYRLLASWCRGSGTLHLLLAHQREDQAETLLLRLGRGSGVDGLSAMAPLGELASVRLLRPLLAVPRVRLAATLERLGQAFIEDPSNQDPRHARVRFRALMPALAAEGLDAARLAGTAARLRRARQALESWTARLLAETVSLDPAGYALVRHGSLVAAPAEIGLRALARTLECVGGRDYAPRLERLERLYQDILQDGLPAARTLGGCRILRLRHGPDAPLLVCREPGGIAGEIPAVPGAELNWDGRYRLRLAPRFGRTHGPVRLGALGESGWAELVGRAPQLRQAPIPAAARAALPALRDLDGVLEVPHLKYGRGQSETGRFCVRHIAFRPPRPLAIGPVTVA